MDGLSKCCGVEEKVMDTYDRYSLLRDKKGYTDYRVCKLAGIETSTMSSWKTKRYEPKIATLRKIAEVLECDVADFYERNVGKYEEVDVFISSIKELKNKFNNVVLEIGNIDIETMKKLVEISDIIEKLECDMTKKGEP